MKRIGRKVYSLLALALFFVADVMAQAPEYGASPYSDQKYDGVSQAAWYESPLLWAGLILLILVLGLAIARRRRKYS